MRRLSIVLAIAASMVACHPNQRATTNWRHELDFLSASNVALTAPAFVRAPEDGTTLRVALHSVERPCDLYASTGPSETDFWYVNIDLGAPDEGEYALGSDLHEEQPRSMRRFAKVRLIEVRDGKKHRSYAAAEGAVSIESAPVSLPSWQSDVRVRGRIRAMFPMKPLHQAECSGSASESHFEHSCRCEDGDGNVSACVPIGDEDCCIGTAPYFSWQVQFDAEKCPSLCAGASAGLYQFCQDVQ